jgi:hypothetical protein
MLAMNKILRLDKALFDHAASIAERAMKSVDGALEYGEVLSLVQDLKTKHTLVQQRTILRSNYKCFTAKIVLRSYGDYFQNMMDRLSLIGFLRTSKGVLWKAIFCGTR